MTSDCSSTQIAIQSRWFAVLFVKVQAPSLLFNVCKWKLLAKQEDIVGFLSGRFCC